MTTRQRLRKGIILVSFFLFPATFYYLSPVIILQAAATSVINGSFIMFGLLFVSSLVLGRGFCGWICPGAGCQEALLAVQYKRVEKGNWIKWLIWLPWLGAIVALAVKAGGYNRAEFLYQTTHGFSIGDVSSLIAYLMVLLLLITLPALIVGRRSFCHHLCWMAPFMILGRKLRNFFRWPSLQLQANSPSCTHCHTCGEDCPMSLPVEEMVQKNALENSECILCGTCVDGCKQGAIVYAWKEKSAPYRTATLK